MGVQGLWQVLESTGRPITLNSLDGKRVAIGKQLRIFVRNVIKMFKYVIEQF